jgi:hypothetical protein
VGPEAEGGTTGVERRDLAHSRRHPIKRLALAFVSPNSYGMVLGLIVATYVAAVTLTGANQSGFVVILQVVTVWFALRTSRASRTSRLMADGVLVLALIAAGGDFLLGGEETLRGLPAMGAVLYFIAPISVIRHLITRPTIDQETVLGALAAYLLIGMCFAFAYRATGLYQSGPFFGAQGDGTMPQILFFSFSTLTTTGYGDLVPAGNAGQSIAVAEMLIGQLFLITTFGKVVNAWRPGRWTAPAPTTSATETPTEAAPPEVS